MAQSVLRNLEAKRHAPRPPAARAGRGQPGQRLRLASRHGLVLGYGAADLAAISRGCRVLAAILSGLPAGWSALIRVIWATAVAEPFVVG